MALNTEYSFIPNEGITDAEKYLLSLCKRTFLSLWSYPGLYKSPGDELSDLLVVFENDIIIFSDKYCKFPDTGNLQLDWSRWFKQAIRKSARQAWGAERWIRNYPDKIFCDKKAIQIFPFHLPDPLMARFHLIVVAHDGSRRCVQELGGSGSFMIRTDLEGIDNHNIPFYIGDLDAKKTFIHILDDTTLNILLGKLDTISDFVGYLTKKEKLFRSSQIILAAGEEELLACYLKKMNAEGEHDFIFPKGYNTITLGEGFWEDFINDPHFKRQKEADEISYLWDKIIERFSFHTLTGTQYSATEPGIKSSERIIRILAKEPRVKRRMLSKVIIELLEKTPSDKEAIRHIGSPSTKDTKYVFFLCPKDSAENYDEYRRRRMNSLELYCYICKNRMPNADEIIGIATEPGLNGTKSEDLLYFDSTEWDKKNQDEIEQLMKESGFPNKLEPKYFLEKEYPDDVNKAPNALTFNLPNNPRNKLCPCGSGKKYKNCHGK